MRAAVAIAGAIVVVMTASPLFVRGSVVVVPSFSLVAVAALVYAIRLDVRTMRGRRSVFDEVAHELVRAAVDPKAFSPSSLVDE
jgi:hypothetical protein